MLVDEDRHDASALREDLDEFLEHPPLRPNHGARVGGGIVAMFRDQQNAVDGELARAEREAPAILS